ncbi:Retrotransposon gag protein [Ceratobasidium sp. AG-Ba]|nr:Retrotransposon gag protein [Ceratobasidium sp. AG-Ba]QRW01187.1 Transposon Tf2-7 polyprotein [Ceratobasidium sp. AG-Ba]
MSQWGSHLSYVPPPPESFVTEPPAMHPLQPHLTGLTDFGQGAGDNTFVQNTPVAPAPPETDNPLILLNTLINEFRSWRDEINGRMTQIENHMQANSFNMAHFNGLHTDLQTIFDQIQAIPTVQRPQLTGTNRQPPPPPVASIPQAQPVRVAPPTAPTVRVKLAKPDKFDGKKDKSTTFKVAITQYLRATYPGISDDDKIAFIISYLDGKASEWIKPHMEHDVLRQAVLSNTLQATSQSQSLQETGAFDVLLARRAEDYTPKTKRLDTLHRAVIDASTLDYIYEQPQEAATHQARIRRQRRRIQNRKLHNVNLFWAEFEKRFGEIDRATKALKKLKSLKQKSSVQDYVTEFQSLAAYVNYDDLALRDMFYEGLKDEIKMAMLSQLFDVKENTTTGQMVVDRALLIDQHLEQFAG